MDRRSMDIQVCKKYGIQLNQPEKFHGVNMPRRLDLECKEETLILKK